MPEPRPDLERIRRGAHSSVEGDELVAYVEHLEQQVSQSRPRVSTLELLQRIRDESEPVDGQRSTIPAGLLDDIHEALEANARWGHLSAQTVTEALQKTDDLFSAVRDILISDPVQRFVGRTFWYECVYCAARSIRLPAEHRAGCAWAALKQAWDNFPANQGDVGR